MSIERIRERLALIGRMRGGGLDMSPVFSEQDVLDLIAEIDRLEARNVSQMRVNASQRKRRKEWVERAGKAEDEAIDAEEERDQLKAENEALRKDAERYRWLRQDDVVQYEISTKCSEEKMDAAIDAAMSKGGRP